MVFGWCGAATVEAAAFEELLQGDAGGAKGDGQGFGKAIAGRLARRSTETIAIGVEDDGMDTSFFIGDQRLVHDL